MKFIDVYFGMKIIVPVLLFTVFILWFIVAMIKATINDKKFAKIKKYMLSIGFKYTLLDVSSVGGKTFYGFVRKGDGAIYNRDLMRMTLKEIKNL